MLEFSPCKINLGLHVVEKRGDGFHNIETVFYPILWEDALEVVESNDNQPFTINFSGKIIEGDLTENIIYKAYVLIKEKYPVPNIKVHLHKNIPMGAGLGGGSSNGATFINLIDKKFNLNIPLSTKLDIAKKLGSDCAFFIEQKPVFATEKGDVFEPITINLNAYYILVVYPQIHSNTKIAYSGVTPKKPELSIRSIIEQKPINEWKNLLVNDFENSVFNAFPEIKELKELLYKQNAIYACMSGSGSSVFGIFDKRPTIEFPKHYEYFLQEPSL
jgi:4-diphosphocytidyl-2-C-methyl-D-erythritol kinase